MIGLIPKEAITPHGMGRRASRTWETWATGMGDSDEPRIAQRKGDSALILGSPSND